MTQEIWAMSARELGRLAILERVESAGLGQSQAAAQMGVSERHLRRLLQRVRAPCTLIAFIDDATSQVTEWRFFEAETTFAYLQCLHRHLRRYGVPLCLYSDRHSIFRVNAKERWALHQDTQFSRASRQLRIERLFQTLQDRPVKELRLQRIATLEQANAFLEGTASHSTVASRSPRRRPRTRIARSRTTTGNCGGCCRNIIAEPCRKTSSARSVTRSTWCKPEPPAWACAERGSLCAKRPTAA